MAFIGGCWDQHGPTGQVCNQEGAPFCPDKKDCSNFPTPCPEIDQGWYGGNATHMPTEFYPPDDNRHEGWCSGDWTLGMISDKVVIPQDIKPGRYVVSWRWDCEETAQVWQNCADVNILENWRKKGKLGLELCQSQVWLKVGIRVSFLLLLDTQYPRYLVQ